MAERAGEAPARLAVGAEPGTGAESPARAESRAWAESVSGSGAVVGSEVRAGCEVRAGAMAGSEVRAESASGAGARAGARVESGVRAGAWAESESVAGVGARAKFGARARRALVIPAPGSIGLEEVAPLIPGPGEIVARPVHVGICGTDLELLAGVVDPAYVRYPLVPGHEWSGLVEAIGPGVTGLAPGQRIIAEGIIPDRVCAQCVRGLTNLCVTYDELGFTRAGAAADQVLVPASVVHPLDDSVSLLDAALAEPLAVAWRGIGRGAPRPGERVAVVGDGTVALVSTHLLRLFSPAELVVFGQRAVQAELAVSLGATGFSVSEEGDGGGAASSGGFDLVVEAAGSAGAVERALRLARRGGRIVLLGLAGNDVRAAFPVDDVVNDDLLIAASFGYTSAAFGEVAALLRAGQITIGSLITHRFPLEKFGDAYAALRSATGVRGKVMLDIATPGLSR